MSDFLANHPISSAAVTHFFLWAAVLGLIVTALMLIEMTKTPASTWSAANVSRSRWVALCAVGIPLVPLGVVVSALWLVRIRPRIAAAVPAGPASTTGWIYQAATTRKSKVARAVVLFLAFLEFSRLFNGIGDWAVGDPGTVHVSAVNHDVEPRAYIAAHCPGSVRRALHLLSDDVELDGHAYQQWSVTPVPGHLNEVLFDPDTGTVLCP